MEPSRYGGYDDKALLELMARDDEYAFTELYHRHRKNLFGYVYNRLRDKERSSEIVQEIFLSFWEKRSEVKILSLRSYLFTAVKFKIISFIRDEKVRSQYAESFYATHSEWLRYDNTNEEQQNLRDINTTIERSIAQLPENYQHIYRMSRVENLSIPEIASRMNISKDTVANYLSYTLKHLRGALGEFMFFAWILLESQ